MGVPRLTGHLLPAQLVHRLVDIRERSIAHLFNEREPFEALVLRHLFPLFTFFLDHLLGFAVVVGRDLGGNSSSRLVLLLGRSRSIVLPLRMMRRRLRARRLTVSYDLCRRHDLLLLLLLVAVARFGGRRRDPVPVAVAMTVMVSRGSTGGRRWLLLLLLRGTRLATPPDEVAERFKRGHSDRGVDGLVGGNKTFEGGPCGSISMRSQTSQRSKQEGFVVWLLKAVGLVGGSRGKVAKWAWLGGRSSVSDFFLPVPWPCGSRFDLFGEPFLLRRPTQIRLGTRDTGFVAFAFSGWTDLAREAKKATCARVRRL